MLTSRKTEIARSARGPKSQGHRAEDVLAESYFVQKILEIWLQPITKSSVKGVNLETIIFLQPWCRTWLPNGSSRIRAKQKFLRKPKGACESSWCQIGSLKSFTLTIPWNLARLVKIFPGIIVRQHHTDRKQSAQSETRYVCCIVAITSGWEMVGTFHGLRNIQDLLSDGKTPHERRWPGGWGPQGRASTDGGGFARVPNLRVCKHPDWRCGTRRGGRMNWHPAVVPSSRRGKNLQSDAKEEEPGCPQGTGNRQAPPVLEVRPGNRQGWRKRSKFRRWGRQITLDKTVCSRMWWHTQGSSGRPASGLGWGSSSKTAPHRPVVLLHMETARCAVRPT